MFRIMIRFFLLMTLHLILVSSNEEKSDKKHFLEPLVSAITISQGKHSYKLVEISNGKPRMPYLNASLRKRINQVSKLKRSPSKGRPKRMKSKRLGLRRMKKQLGAILTVIAKCQTLKKGNSKEKCQDKTKKYILRFMKGASNNRFKYIL